MKDKIVGFIDSKEPLSEEAIRAIDELLNDEPESVPATAPKQKENEMKNVVFVPCNYHATQLVSAALVRINALDAFYHDYSADRHILFIKSRAAYDSLFMQCQLVDADIEKVMTVAKALKRRKRRHGIHTPSYSLDSDSLRRFFATHN